MATSATHLRVYRYCCGLHPLPHSSSVANARARSEKNPPPAGREPVLVLLGGSPPPPRPLLTARMPRPSNGALLQTGAISAATILGSGILGLPVSLSRAGLPPFLLSFTVTFFAQVGVVYMTTELLQRVHAARGKRAAAARAAQQEMLHYATGALAPRDADEISPRSDDVDRASGSGADGGDGLGSRSSSTFEDAPPGLHAFSELYLPHWTLKVLFETAVLFHFVSIMSSYALGAPQAFREVAPFLKAIPESVLVLAFTTLGAFVIVVFSDAVVAPLTFLTFIKGSLLTVMVLIVLFVGFGIGLHPSADWSISAGVESFLMGTLALSGVINLMPKLWDICIKSLPGYQGDVVDEKFVSYFRKAVNLALFVCYVLNCLYVSSLGSTCYSFFSETFPLFRALLLTTLLFRLLLVFDAIWYSCHV